jgi:hypothetical protein
MVKHSLQVFSLNCNCLTHEECYATGRTDDKIGEPVT